MIRPIIEPTEDGTPTLRHPVFGDTYHSTRGATGESMHVYIRQGFAASGLPHVRLLEVGFDSGLNAWLTARAAFFMNRTVAYTALEPYPVDPRTAAQLSYGADRLFMALHEAPWNVPARITERFRIRKVETSLQDYEFDTTFDLVYFDAFAPDTQPELWTADVFRRIFDILSEGGLLVTYSAKGTVKRNLREAGFDVKRLPGALGKRHMVRAVRPPVE